MQENECETIDCFNKAKKFQSGFRADKEYRGSESAGAKGALASVEM